VQVDSCVVKKFARVRPPEERVGLFINGWPWDAAMIIVVVVVVVVLAID
jgi:hypothetical protein